jgi:hypothetical protein
MPRVIVLSDSNNVLLDERVTGVLLSDDHYAEQFIERLGWAVEEDVTRLEMVAS